METYRNNELPARQASHRKAPRSTRTTARSKKLKQKDLTKYLTLDYVRRALAVIDYRLEKKDAQTAKYVLEMYFGKAGVARRHKKPLVDQKKQSVRKPNLHVSTEFIEKLAQKYFPKPNWNNSGNGERKPET